MAHPVPGAPRRFTTPDGAEWEARLLRSGRPSPYLAPRLACPLVEFRRLTPPRHARRYAPLPGPGLAGLDQAALLALWTRARSS
jgi:hypothetical protein